MATNVPEDESLNDYLPIQPEKPLPTDCCGTGIWFSVVCVL